MTDSGSSECSYSLLAREELFEGPGAEKVYVKMRCNEGAFCQWLSSNVFVKTQDWSQALL